MVLQSMSVLSLIGMCHVFRAMILWKKKFLMNLKSEGFSATCLCNCSNFI